MSSTIWTEIYFKIKCSVTPYKGYQWLNNDNKNKKQITRVLNLTLKINLFIFSSTFFTIKLQGSSMDQVKRGSRCYTLSTFYFIFIGRALQSCWKPLFTWNVSSIVRSAKNSLWRLCQVNCQRFCLISFQILLYCLKGLHCRVRIIALHFAKCEVISRCCDAKYFFDRKCEANKKKRKINN